MTFTKDTLASAARAGKTIWAAGAYDALSARLIEESGFDAVMTSGFGISSSFLGQPDAELYTMTENLTVVRNVVSAVRVPVIADIDTAYGNAINAMRTVREFEAAGVTAVLIEDQVAPKRCPCVADGVPILELDEAVSKIEAAVHARRNRDMLIVARTDATDPEECFRRARAFVKAGADLIQPISKSFQTFEGLKKMRDAAGVPLSLQLLGWLERDLTREQIEQVAGLATYPLVALMTVTDALRRNLGVLAKSRSSANLPLPVTGLDEFGDFIGFPEIRELEKQFLRASV